MTIRISEIAGVSPQLAEALKARGLDDSDKLLAAAATPQARAQLAAELGVTDREILEIANRADLARIKGIGKVYSDLLEFAGVDTVMELRNRNPDNLYEKIVAVSAEHHVRRIPRRDQVHDWVAQARRLDRAIEY